MLGTSLFRSFSARPLSVARLASSPSFLGKGLVLFGKFMAIATMRPSSGVCDPLSNCSFPADTLPSLGRHDCLIRKPGVGSINYCVQLSSRLIRKLCGFVGNSFNLNVNSVSPVKVLFPLSRPSAIIRGIPPLVVDSVESQPLFVRWQHIVSKIFVGRYPPIADLNSSSPVVFVLRVVRIVASGLHGLPNIVSRWVYFERHNQLLSVGSSYSHHMRSDTRGK